MPFENEQSLFGGLSLRNSDEFRRGKREEKKEKKNKRGNTVLEEILTF